MSKKQFKYSLIDNLTGNSPEQYKKNSKEEIRQALIDVFASPLPMYFNFNKEYSYCGVALLSKKSLCSIVTTTTPFNALISL